jgi:hypothetical protein
MLLLTATLFPPIFPLFFLSSFFILGHHCGWVYHQKMRKGEEGDNGLLDRTDEKIKKEIIAPYAKYIRGSIPKNRATKG